MGNIFCRLSPRPRRHRHWHEQLKMARTRCLSSVRGRCAGDRWDVWWRRKCWPGWWRPGDGRGHRQDAHPRRWWQHNWKSMSLIHLSSNGIKVSIIYLGVVREPSAFSRTLACVPSMTATQELVVPKSIPATRPWTCPAARERYIFGSTDFNIFAWIFQFIFLELCFLFMEGKRLQNGEISIFWCKITTETRSFYRVNSEPTKSWR